MQKKGVHHKSRDTLSPDTLSLKEGLQFPQLPDAFPDPILITNTKGEIYYVNKAWEKLTGYTFSEVKGRNQKILRSEKTSSSVYKDIWDTLSRGKTFIKEEVIDYSKSGKEYYIRSLFFPIRKTGKSIYFVQTQQDITERKKLERELDELRERYIGIFESSKDAIGYADLTGRITDINNAFIKLTGYKREELIGKTFFDITPPEYINEGKQFIKKVVSTGKSAEYEKEYVLQNGKRIPILVTAFLVKDFRGNTRGLAAVIKDISAQKAAEKALRESEHKYKSLMQNSSEGIVLYSPDGSVLEVNRAICSMLGYSKEELLQMHQYEFTDVDTLKTNPPKMKEILKGKTIRNERVLVKKDGSEVPVELIAKKLPHDIVEVLYRDISQRKRAEELKDTFIGVAAHELKTPVTSIKAYTQLLSRKLKNSDQKDLANITDQMNTQVIRLIALIDELLNVNKIESGRFMLQKRETDTDACIREVVDELQTITTTHNIRIQGKANRKIMCDRNKLGQVIINLLSNAIKYSPNAGKVVVLVKAKGKQVIVGVRDFGFGIDINDQKKIFELFYRTKDKEESKISGFGLGLYIASEIIKKHKGKIWVESEKGKGSTFYFSLPIITKE